MTIYFKIFVVLYLLSMASGKNRNNITCKYFKPHFLSGNNCRKRCDAAKAECFYKCRNYPVNFQSTSRKNSANIAASEKDIRANCLKTCERCNMKEDCLTKSEIHYIQTDIFEYSACSKFPIEYCINFDKNKQDQIIVEIASGNTNSYYSVYGLIDSANTGFLRYNTSCYRAEEAILDLLLNPHINHGRPFKIIDLRSDVLTSEAKSLLLPDGILTGPLVDNILLEHLKTIKKMFHTHNPFISKLVPDIDIFRRDILVDFMKKNNYRFISIVYDNDDYEYWYRIFKSKFDNANICISSSYRYLPDNINKITETLSNDIYAEAIVLVVATESTAIKIIKPVNNFQTFNKTWLIYFTMDIMPKFVPLENVIFYSSSIFSFVSNRLISDVTTTLNSFFQSEIVNSSKHWHEFVKMLLSTYFQNLFKTFSNYYLLINYNFTYVYKAVANINLLQRSECTNGACRAGYYNDNNVRHLKCCSICRLCKHGTFKYGYGNHKCQSCPRRYIPSTDRTYCSLVVRRSTDTHKYTTYFLCSVGVLSCIVFIIIFTLNSDTPVVKSSDYKLCIIQIITHLLLFIQLLLFTVHPHFYKFICILRPVGVGFLLTLVLSITFSKIQRLLFIFQAKIRLSRKKILLSTLAERSMVVTACLIQMGLSALVLLFFIKPVFSFEENWLHSEYVSCNEGNVLTLQIGFAFTLSIICTVQAFRSRNLPENFNESTSIFFAVSITSLILLTIVPLQFSKMEINDILFLDAITLFLANTSLLFIVFGYKVFIIVCKPDENTREAFRMKRLKKLNIS